MTEKHTWEESELLLMKLVNYLSVFILQLITQSLIVDHVVTKTHLCILFNGELGNGSCDTVLTAEGNREMKYLEGVCFVLSRI
jgi:hypothetical protein